MNIRIRCSVIIGLGLCGRIAFGHDVPVHRAITANAAASAVEESSAYDSFLNVVASDDFVTANAANSMVLGSDVEDNKVPPTSGDGGGYRSVNHFYDPLDDTYGKGLSEAPPDHRVVIGTNSFAWASISNCVGYNFKFDMGSLDINGIMARNVNTSNRWSWPNARDYEWLGLTATNKADRQTALTNMFRTIGQVMHLVEDLSQPQHVRNEQHVNPFAPNSWLEKHDAYASPIEIYGREHVNQLNYQHGMLPWKADGFTKLEDFWDRHLYNGSGVVLDNAEHGGTQLGLAEWCNGNFLGARHLFPEYYKPADIEYYPYPSRDHSTDYSDVKVHPANHVDTYTLGSVTNAKGIYLAKTGDGVTYNHIARVNYLGAKIPDLTGPRYCTIDDPDVLKDYHDEFIPKAVEYAAGLIDYFFRGTIDVPASGYDTNLMLYTNLIVNTSSQTFSGGTFSLYQDDSSGNRERVGS